MARPPGEAPDLPARTDYVLCIPVTEPGLAIRTGFAQPSCAGDTARCAFDSVAAIPVLPRARSPDRHHQAAQHHAHGCEEQPTDAVFHTKHSSPLPAYRTGLDRVCPCPAGSYQHSRTGRYPMPEPILRPQEVSPKRGSSQRVPMALPFGTQLPTGCTTHATGTGYAGTTYVLHLHALTAIFGPWTALHRRPSVRVFVHGYS